MAYRVVLLEDHPALREGLAMLLRRQGFEVIAGLGDAVGAAELIVAERPDVTVIDLGLPGESGLDLARRLARRDGSLGLLIYTGSVDPVLLQDALDCGARGFVVKGSPAKVFLSAVHAVAAGGGFVDPVIRKELLARTPGDRDHVLSVREREIVDLLARGLTGEAVAERLCLSPETVRTHVRNAMRKLGAGTRTHAIVLALAHGEIRLDPDGNGDSGAVS